MTMFSINKCPQVRKKLYKIFVEIAKDENPLIFEEWLFSGFDADSLVNDLLLNENYPSHVTTSLFYECLGFDLSANYKSEAQTKERAVFVRPDQSLKFKHRGGVMNFSSIHDTESLMQSILGEVVESQTDKYEKYQNILKQISKKISFLTKQDPQDNLKIAILKVVRLKVIFCVTNHLFQRASEEDFKVFEYFAKEKIATMAFSGGGGFMLTCGDESGDIKSRALFLPRSKRNRFMHSSFTREYEDFISALVEIDDRVLDFCKKRIKATNDKNGVPDQEITLEDIDKFQRTLPRSNDLKSRLAFAELKSKVGKDLKQDKMLQNAANDELDRLEESYVNFGKGPLAGRLDLRKFIAEINQILAQMPEGQFGHFSEVLHLPDKPELVIVARTNGRDFKIANDAPPRCQCDLIILNVDDANPFTIDDEDLHKIYMEFERIVGAPYDGSYSHISKANLYLSGQIVNLSSKKEVMSVGRESFELPEYEEVVSSKAQSTKASALGSSSSRSPTPTFP